MAALNSLSSQYWSTTNVTNGLLEPPTGSMAVDSLLLWSITTDNVEVLRLTLVNQNLPVDCLLNWRAVPAALSRRRTISMIAAYHGSCGVLSLLLSHGADPNARSPDDGYTPLHCAAEGARPNAPQVIALLLQFGALPDVYDVAGRKPVDLLQPRLNQAQKDSVFSSSLLDAELNQDAQGSTDDDSELDKAEYQTDAFRMYEFKVTKCPRTRAHDWTECPFAHPGEKARRRNPQKFVYCGSACPDFRKGSCKRGDACQYAHGVFECWLHPSRYRTQLCKDAPTCTRRVCFFAHSLEELRQPTETLTLGSADGVSVTSDADAASEPDSEVPCAAAGDNLESAGSVSIPPPSSPTSSVPSFGTSSEGGHGGHMFSSSSSSDSHTGSGHSNVGVPCSSPLPSCQPLAVSSQADALASNLRDLQLSTAMELAKLRSQMYQNLSTRDFPVSANGAFTSAKVSATVGALNFANRSASCESLDTSWINVLTAEEENTAFPWIRNVAA